MPGASSPDSSLRSAFTDDASKESYSADRSVRERLERRNQRRRLSQNNPDGRRSQKSTSGEGRRSSRESTQSSPTRITKGEPRDAVRRREFYENEDSPSAEDTDGDGQNLRKRRRFRRRGRQQSQSVVTEMVDIGAKASRIAQKTTGKIWNDLLEATYDDDVVNDPEFLNGNNRQRRRRRRAGFNWPDIDRLEPRRTRRRTQKASIVADPNLRNDEKSFEKNAREYFEETRSARYSKQKRYSRKQRNDVDPVPAVGGPSTRSSSGTSARASPTGDEVRKPESEPVNRQQERPDPMPIGQILAALDERDILYSPKATRKELEDLLLNYLNTDDVVAVKKAEEDIEVIEVEYISPEDWKRQQEEKLRKQRMEEPTQNPNKAKPMQSDSSNNNNEKVTGSTRPNNGTFQQNLKNAYRRADSNRTPFEPQRTERHAPGTSKRPRTKQYSSQKSPRANQRKRRVYSPFQRTGTSTDPSSPRKNVSNELKDDFDRFGDTIEDDLDRVGEYFADAVDEIFWGSARDESHSSSERKANKRDESKDCEDTDSQQRSSSSKRHWKDRAEERLDRAMGIQSTGGKTYDRWTRQEENEASEVKTKGYDAVAYTRGQRRPHGYKKKTRVGNSRKVPFWEEEGSIFDILLGHNWDDSRPSQRSLRTNLNDLFGSSHSITVLVRNMLLVLARITSSVCSWASVQNTIPRPIVFLSAAGAGFVSRPGWRIKNILLALFSARLLGEWLSEPERLFENGRRGNRQRGSPRDGGKSTNSN